jgi:hypothetical protein
MGDMAEMAAIIDDLAERRARALVAQRCAPLVEFAREVERRVDGIWEPNRTLMELRTQARAALAAHQNKQQRR